MRFEEDAYSVECPEGSDRAILRGVMRLASPQAYEEALTPLRARIEAGERLIIDIAGVPFMNSSGIRAVAGLVLLARDSGAPLHLLGCQGVPWQKKTSNSLRAINPSLTVELR